jgi:hypothetical protein
MISGRLLGLVALVGERWEGGTPSVRGQDALIPAPTLWTKRSSSMLFSGLTLRNRVVALEFEPFRAIRTHLDPIS